MSLFLFPCPLGTNPMNDYELVRMAELDWSLVKTDVGSSLYNLFLSPITAWNKNLLSVLNTWTLNVAPSALGGVTGPGWKPVMYFTYQKYFLICNFVSFFTGNKYRHLMICLQMMAFNCKSIFKVGYNKQLLSSSMYRKLLSWNSSLELPKVCKI